MKGRPVEAAPKLALTPEQAEDLARVKAEIEQKAADQHRKDLLKTQEIPPEKPVVPQWVQCEQDFDRWMGGLS